MKLDELVASNAQKLYRLRPYEYLCRNEHCLTTLGCSIAKKNPIISSTFLCQLHTKRHGYTHRPLSLNEKAVSFYDDLTHLSRHGIALFIENIMELLETDRDQ